MSGESVTFALNGDVPLDQFAVALHHWSALLTQLAVELQPQAKIEWIIEDLQTGSAIMTARPVTDDANSISPILRAYADIARDLQNLQEPTYSPKVRKHAHAIVQQIGPNITSVRFETPDEDVTITAHRQQGTPVTPLKAFGTVGGRVQTLSSRHRLGFTLYDSLFDRAVNCYLKAEQQHLIIDKWDTRVVVEGMISRDPDTGRPVAIRDITDVITISEQEHGDYRDAAGLFPLESGEESGMVTLRRLRDEW